MRKLTFKIRRKPIAIASILFFFLVFSTAGLAQNQIDFVVVDEDKNPVSYANVYGAISKKGTYSDLEGKVHFNYLLQIDTLVISCVGYKKRQILVSEISDTVFLTVFSNKLPSFTVKSEYEKETIGIKRKIFLASHSEGRFAGSINGMVFSDVRVSFLESVSLFIDKPEDSSRTKFLLMVYSVDDSTSFPTEPILTQQYFFDVSKKGWSKINLDSLYIPLTGKFYIGIETVPNFIFDDAPILFEWAQKPTAKYRCISYLFKELTLNWVWGYSGGRYFYGIDGTENEAHNNFPLIKATIKY